MPARLNVVLRNEWSGKKIRAQIGRDKTIEQVKAQAGPLLVGPEVGNLFDRALHPQSMGIRNARTEQHLQDDWTVGDCDIQDGDTLEFYAPNTAGC